MLRKWQQRWGQVVTKLGFSEKAKEGKLTKDEQKQIFSQYQTDYGISFEADKKLNEEGEAPHAEDYILSAEEQTQIAATLGIIPEENAGGGNGDGAAPNTPPTPPTTGKEATSALMSRIEEQNRRIAALESKPETQNPLTHVSLTDKASMPIILGHTAHSKTHLFGIEVPMFARGKWWNDIAVTGKATETKLLPHQITSFREAFNEFGATMKERVNELSASKQLNSLNYEKMVLGDSSIDYSSLEQTLGAQYLVRRQDLIIAYLRMLESVAPFFPVRSGVQDNQYVTNSFFGEFSTSYQSGRIFKGDIKLTAELYHVDDVMYKHMFSNLKQLENEYIGYLNKEGSNPMKWSFIEWMLINIFKVLFNEQQRRRVIGVRVPVQVGVDNPAMLAGNGVLRAIEKIEEDLKVLPFSDLKVYDETTILDYYEQFFGYVDNILPNMNNMQLFANNKHRKWYIKAYRAKYGHEFDFKGPEDKIIDLSPEKIQWVPNMDLTDYKIWMTFPGNIENYELTPGEMFALYFQQDLEALMSMSWWKEGSGLQMGGLQCASVAELEATNRKHQFIFTNYPVSQLADGGVALDGSVNTLWQTANNTAATAITTIDNSSRERVYKIICGGTTNATTIAQSGIFAKITAPWVPTAIGDYIKVYAELASITETINGNTVIVTKPTGNFLELERKVTPAS